MLKKSALAVTGGLSLATPRAAIEPGRAIDCLNYEYIDTLGAKRCDGFTKWDGGAHPVSEALYVMSLIKISIDPTPTAGQVLLRERLSDSQLFPFGVLVNIVERTDLVTPSVYDMYFMLFDGENLPRLGEVVHSEGALGSYVAFGSIGHTTDEHPPSEASLTPLLTSSTVGHSDAILQMINDWGEVYNSEVYSGARPPSTNLIEDNPTTILGENFTPAPVLGGVYFDDRFYAVVDSAVVMQATELKAQVYPNDIITNQAGTSCALVVKAELIAGAWDGATSEDVAKLHIVPITRNQKATGRIQGAGFGIENAFGNSQNLAYIGRSGVRWTTALLDDITFNANANIEAGDTASIWQTYTASRAQRLGGVYKILSSAGAGYDYAPTVAITTTGAGTGAKAVAVMDSTLGAGLLKVGQIVVTDPGSGYLPTDTITVTLTGGTPSTAATASVEYLTGWEFAGLHPSHNGWLVRFDAGNSPSGYLTKLERSNSRSSQSTTWTSSSTSNVYPRKVLTGMDFDGAINYAPLPWYPSTGTDINADAIIDVLDSAGGDGGINVLMRASEANNGWNSNSIGFTQFSGLSSLIPENSVIVGVTLSVSLRVTVSATMVGGIDHLKLRANLITTTNSDLDPSARTETKHGNTQEITLTIPTGTGAVSADPVVFGSTTDLWGLIDKKDDFFRNPDFGVALSLHAQRVNAALFPDAVFQIDRVQLSISYKTPSTVYYFKDPSSTNCVKAQLVDYIVVNGALKTKDARGYMQLTKLEQVTFAAAPIPAILDNWVIYADSGLTSQVGVVDGEMIYNGLPNYTSLKNEGGYPSAKPSRYQLITSNFYGNEEWESVYGVSGSGRAFEFDGVNFSRIFALPPEYSISGGNTFNEGNDEKDKPRHIANFLGSLTLGYSAGSVLMSRPGEPHEFSPLKGAVEIAVGDKVNGLQVLSGEYLGVFCENKIDAIPKDLSQAKTLSPNSGCIEYSLQSIGNTPVYCDTQGVSTLDQSDKYGDFLGRRLSRDVYTWLRPRLGRGGATVSGRSAGLVCSYVSRSKGQYRVWFEDGYQLIMNFSGPDSEPQFSIGKFYLRGNGLNSGGWSLSGSTAIVVPIFVSSNTSSSGKEEIIFYPDMSKAVDNEVAATVYDPNPNAATNYIMPYLYKANSFWWNEGAQILPIPAYVTIAAWDKDDPFSVGTLKKVRVEGMSRHVATLGLKTESGLALPYDEEGTTFVNGLTTSGAVSCDLERSTEYGLPENYDTRENIANRADETGRLITMRFGPISAGSMGTSLGGSTTQNIRYYDDFFSFGPVYFRPEPAHYLQIILAQHEGGREDA